jgi:CDP-glucose 4,6-dehydratase
VSDGATFVTGASGLIGRWLVRALLDRGDRVVVLRRAARGAPAPQGCEVVCGDVTDAAVLERVVTGHEVATIFHLAARSIVGIADRAPAATFATNLVGTWTVLEAARAAGVRRVVVASSDKAYGRQEDGAPYTEDLPLRPTRPYDVSKAGADLIARSYWHTFGLPVATTRFANVYGGGDPNPSRLIPELVAAALDGRAAHVRSDGTPERDFLYVEDAVAAYLAIADALDRGPDARGQAFNAGGGRPVSVREVVDTVGRVAGAPLDARYEPATASPGDAGRQWVDTTKIRAVCGWEPLVDLEEGLRRTLDWYRARR